MNPTAETFTTIVAAARRATGMSAAEFDNSLVCRDGRALGALADACYRVANQEQPPVDTFTRNEDLRQRAERAAALHTRMRAEIDAMVAAADRKTYRGWSEATPGPIAYGA